MFAWLHANILYVLLSISIVISVFWLIGFQKTLRIRWYAGVIIAVLIVATGVLGAKLFAMLENAIAGSGDGNISLYGALFLTPLVCLLGALIFKRPLRAAMDVFTLPIVCAATFARVNCLFAGCCQGVLIPGTETHVPTRGIELAFDVVFLVIIARMTAKKQFKGINYPLYLLCYGVLRFILQWFREGGFEVLGSLTLSHLWSILSAIVGLVLTLVLLRSYKQPSKNLPKNKKKSANSR